MRRLLEAIMPGLLLIAFPALPQESVSLQQNVSLQQGIQALETERADEAVAIFRQALDRGRAAGLPPASIFPIRIALVSACLESGELREAERTLQEASRSEARNGGPFARAELANGWGALHVKQGRFEEARAEFLDALSQIEANANGRALMSNVLNNLAAAEAQLGEYPQAVEHQAAALRGWETFLPAAHPFLIKGYASLASVQYLAKDTAAAQKSMETAIALARRTYGDESPTLADLLASDAIILRNLHRKREARAAEKEARRIGGSKRNTRATYTVTFNAKTAAIPANGVQAIAK